MIRCRFVTTSSDPRPVNWPIKHPYWITGQSDDAYIIVAYADDEEEILRNWPEATELDSERAKLYAFGSRFPKPVWFNKE